MSSSLSATMQQRSRPKKCDTASSATSVPTRTDGSGNNCSMMDHNDDEKTINQWCISFKDKGADGVKKLFGKGSTPWCYSLKAYFRYCSLWGFRIFFVLFILGFVIRFDQFNIRSKQIAVTSSSSPLSSWSNPLSSEMKDGCWQWEGPSISDSQTKRNNNINVSPHDLTPPKGLVVSVLMGVDVTKSVCTFFPSQVKHFFLHQRGLDVLFLLPSPDSDHVPSPQSTMDEVLECLHLQNQQPVAIKTWDNIDGTKLTTYEYTYDFMLLEQATTTSTNVAKNATSVNKKLTETMFRNSDSQQQPSQKEAKEKKKTFSVFLAYTAISFPRYVKDLNYDIKNLTITPHYCNAPVQYIQGTRWYVNELLHLGILKQGNYEYFLKVDTDISFRKPFPIQLLHDMKLRGAVFGHARWYDDGSCGQQSLEMLQEFRQHYMWHKFSVEQNGTNTNRSMINNNAWRKKLMMDSFDETGVSKDHLMTDWIPRSSWKGEICSANHSNMHLPHDLYYSNFIIGRTDYFQTPEVRALGQFVSEWPHGFFEHRWGDQIFWGFALGYFIGPNFEQVGAAVVDYTEFRCESLKELKNYGNCWESMDDKMHFRNVTSECYNDAVFRHEKSREFTSPWSIVDNWNAYETQDESFEWIQQSSPHATSKWEKCPDD